MLHTISLVVLVLLACYLITLSIQHKLRSKAGDTANRVLLLGCGIMLLDSIYPTLAPYNLLALAGLALMIGSAWALHRSGPARRPLTGDKNT